MSDTETVDLCNMSGYDVMETRLKCLELAIKALNIAECDVSDNFIIGLAKKFEEFVLKDMEIPNHL